MNERLPSLQGNRSGKAKVLSKNERDLIHSQLPEKYRLISEVLYWSAGRISEVLSIRVRNLVPSTGMVVLESRTTKTKKTREVFLPKPLMQQLVLRASGLRLKQNDFLFNQSPTRTNGDSEPLSSQSFDKERVVSATGTVCPASQLTPSVAPN